MAHVMMLAKQGILTDDEKQQILDGLESIRRDVESGKLEDYRGIRRYPQFCRGKSDRPDRGCRKEAAYRKKP